MKRETGIDLFRILGLLFVNGVHAFLYNGFYAQAQTGWAMWLSSSFRWLFFGCNAMFLLLTGYLKSTKPWNKSYYRGPVGVLIGYVLTCLVSYPIRYYLLGERDALFVWIERFFTFSNYSWYIEMYIGLILISPLINLAVSKLEKPKHLLLLAGGCVAATTLHSITALDIIPDYFSASYPITLYVLGAVIRKLQPKISAPLALGGAALTAMGLGACSILTATAGFSTGFTQGYGGFWITVMVVCLFLGIYRLRLPQKVANALAFLSAGVLEGYILSRLLDVWVYDLAPQWHSPEYYPLIFLCITVPIFLISLAAGRALHGVSAAIVNRIWRKK